MVSGEVLGTVSYYRQGAAEAALVCDLVASRDVAAALDAPGATQADGSALPAVSYTHLDVYKRQAIAGLRAGLNDAGIPDQRIGQVDRA